MKTFRLTLIALVFFFTIELGFAQEHPTLHVNPKWKECSFQLDPSLTQQAWHQFTKEAALVSYFRPLTDAKPMGARNFEISVLQWKTGIDDSDAAWNDTFVHHDSTHWLMEGSRLAFPGLTVRAGITDKLDVGVYATKSFGANYGFLGGQIQYNVINDLEKKWSASARFTFASLFGPEDLNTRTYGLDAIASKEFKIYSDKILLSPYVVASTYLASANEKTDQVDLRDENVMGGQVSVGATLKLSIARLGVEYNFARVSTLSFKIGVGF